MHSIAALDDCQLAVEYYGSVSRQTSATNHRHPRLERDSAHSHLYDHEGRVVSCGTLLEEDGAFLELIFGIRYKVDSFALTYIKGLVPFTSKQKQHTTAFVSTVKYTILQTYILKI